MHQTSQFTVINESQNRPLPNVYVNAKRKTYAIAAKSNNIADYDFLKTLLPLTNTFVTQLVQKIIECLPVIHK